MPSVDTKTLEFNQYRKSDKTTFIIYADLKSLIEKTDGCKNNPEKLSTTKVSEHILSGFSMWTLHYWHTQKINIVYTEIKIA